MQVARQAPEGLGKRILRHWQKYRPKTVQRLKAKGLLNETVNEAAEEHAQTVSQMLGAGFGADQADEVAREPWISPETRTADDEGPET